MRLGIKTSSAAVLRWMCTFRINDDNEDKCKFISNIILRRSYVYFV